MGVSVSVEFDRGGGENAGFSQSVSFVIRHSLFHMWPKLVVIRIPLIITPSTQLPHPRLTDND